MEDIRIVKNKRELEQALLFLLERKDFIRITVNEICQQALVGRSTFYHHYLDKYDLLEKVVAKYSKICEQVIIERFEAKEIEDVEKSILKAYQTLLQHREALATLLTIHVKPNCDLEENLKGLLTERFCSLAKETSIRHRLPQSFVTQLLTSNALEIAKYLLSAREEIDIAQLATVISIGSKAGVLTV